MIDFATLGIKVDSREVKTAARDIDKLDQNLQGAGRSSDSASGAMRAFGAVLAGIGIQRTVSQIISMSDQLANLRGQLKLVTSSQSELNSVYNQSLALANRTGGSLDSTINLYARLARSTQELNLSQQQLFTITEAINQSFVVSGASTQEAASATLQLSQGLAAGVLRGEELNSVMENSPRLARALAEGLGVTIGQLRQLGADGELTAEAVTSALSKMAGSIDADFQQMPITVERATQEMRNNLMDLFGSVDTSGAVSAVQELNDVLSDPEVRASIKLLNQGIIDLTGSLASLAIKAAAAGVELSKYTPAGRIGQGIAWFIDKGRELGFWSDELDRLGEELVKPITNFDGLNMVVVTATKVKKEDLSALTSLSKEYQNFQKQVQRVMDELYPHEAVARELVETHRLLTQALEDGLITQEQFTKWMQESGYALQEVEVTAKRVTTEIKSMTNRADPMAKAYERGIERMRDGFGDFFQRLIVDGRASFSDLLDLFKRMIAEMIATAAANRIMVGVGLGSASAAASAGGLLTGGGLLGQAGGLLSSGASALGLQGLASNAYFGLTNTGYNLAGSLGLNVTDVGALGIGSLATAGAGMAGSFIGGSLGGALTGKEANSNIGAMAGSAIGAFGGPLGAFIGGTIGGFVDSLFGSTGNKFASTSVDLATGEVFRSRGGGESLSNTQKITDALTDFANIIGGSSARIEVGIGRKTGFELRTGAEAGTAAQSERFKTADELVSAAMINIIENAKNLAPEVVDLAKSFKGTAEQTAAYTVAMQNLYLQSEANPIDQVVKTFAESQKTAYWIYQDQIRAIKEMSDAFDGSAASAQQLNSALSVNQQVAFALAQQYQNIALSAGVTAAQSAQGIRESAMSRPELMASLMFQREGLMDRLQQETDAQKLADTFNEYIRLNERIFGLIDNPSTEQAERYAQLQESAAELVERRTEDLITKLENEQRAQNLEVRDAMLNAAAQQQTAADTMLLAAQSMQQAIQNFNFSGVFGGFPSGEVNA